MHQRKALQKIPTMPMLMADTVGHATMYARGRCHLCQSCLELAADWSSWSGAGGWSTEVGWISLLTSPTDRNVVTNWTTDPGSPVTGSGTARGGGSRPGSGVGPAPWRRTPRPGRRRRLDRRAETAGSDNDAAAVGTAHARRDRGRRSPVVEVARPGCVDIAARHTAAAPACASATLEDFSFRSSTIPDRPTNSATPAPPARRRSGRPGPAAAGLECLEGKPPPPLPENCGKRPLTDSTRLWCRRPSRRPSDGPPRYRRPSRRKAASHNAAWRMSDHVQSAAASSPRPRPCQHTRHRSVLISAEPAQPWT